MLLSISPFMSAIICILGLDTDTRLSGERICLQWRRPEFDSWRRKIPWRRKWQPIPIFLPEKSHGRRSLMGYSPWNSPSQNTEVGSLFLLQRDLPNPGIEPRSSTLQADALLSELPERPQRMLEWVAIPFSRRSSQPRD